MTVQPIHAKNWKRLVGKSVGFSAAMSFSTSAMLGQEALRESLAGSKSAEARELAIENQPYNIKAGPVSLLFDASLGIELNDNINLAETGRQDDVIFQPKLNIRAFWPVTQQNSLNFSLGVGYAKYLNNSQYDYPSIAPGSALSFDIFAGDFLINLHDRFSYIIDPLENGDLSGVVRLSGFSNTAGVNTDWDLNKLILSVGYDHFNFASTTSAFEYLDRSSELFFGRAAFRLNPTTTAGLEATGSLNDYQQNILHDNSTYSAGLFGSMQLTENFQFTARAGYVNYLFDSGDQNGQTSDRDMFYFGLGLRHRINQFLSQSIQGRREARLGLTAEYVERYLIWHQMNWNIIRDVKLVTELYFEHGILRNLQTESSFDRFGGLIYATYQLTEKLFPRLAYRYTLKNSDVAGSDYYQNSLMVDLTYRF